MSKGLRFRKLDLHVHTGGSYDFEGPVTPDDIVKAALDRGLDGIAVTDHNTGSWVDKVKEAAIETDLVVFPGVEVTCDGGKEGIHIVVLFDPSKDTAHVTAFLSAIGITPDKQGTPEALVGEKIGVIGVIEKAVNEWGGLAVPAHVNSTKGILHDMRGQQRTRIIQHQNLLAVEATDFDKVAGKRTIDFLDGSDLTYQRKLAVYQASDNRDPDGNGGHCLQSIGSRCAYFKLEKINLEGLRQCFVDPDVRIRQDFEFALYNYPYIKEASVTSGFLDGQTVTFHQGLTTVVGSKGSGKSLFIEFLRFALNQEPKHSQIADDHAAKLNERLGEYGVVRVVVVNETGNEVEIERTYRELDQSPYNDTVPYDPAQVFPVLFLSQNEIIKIAENEEDQLDFIDQFFDFRTFRSTINSIEQQLETLDGVMADGLRAFAEVEELDEKIATFQAEIVKTDTALSHPVFEKFRELGEKERILSDQIARLTRVFEEVKRTRERIMGEFVVPPIPESFSRDPALQRNRDLMQQTRDNLADYFARLLEDLNEQKQNAENERESWLPVFEKGKSEYEAYIQQMGSDYQGLAKQRERTNRQLKDLEARRAVAAIKKDRVREISSERNALLDSLQSAYAKYTEQRKAKCERFQNDSAGKLQLRILDSSNTDEFRARLLSLKRGSYLREDDIHAICDSINPRDFVIRLLRYQAAGNSSHLEDLANAANIDIRRMKTLADFLLASIPYEELLSLQYKVLPKDRPEIRYNIGDGEYQLLSKVSVGQKCTAMLIMALSDGKMPIVIDQPEDSLDIRSIWEDMCRKLRLGKEKRQFIFTTHNSSLAVASDTDCFVIMEATSSHGEVVFCGSMDHDPINLEVLKYMEGGKGTYGMKRAKYGSITG